MNDTKYSAVLTGEPFLFYESRQVARLKLTGCDEQKIRKEVIKYNLFQYATEKSLTKRVNAVLKRLARLDDEMLRFLADKPSDTAKVINLYAIMASNRLMYDFMMEVVAEKFEQGDLLLQKRDLNEFFIGKREQHEKIARWTDNTIVKLKQVLIRIIFEAGILVDRDAGTLQRIILEAEVEKCLRAKGETDLLRAIGCE